MSGLSLSSVSDAFYNGTSGTPFSVHAVAAAWEITEDMVGGSVLTVKASWYATDELPGFNRKICAIRKFNGSEWMPAPLGAASGNAPRTRTGLGKAGLFAVMDGAAALSQIDIRENSGAGGEAKLFISPNPATDFVTLRLEGDDFADNVEIELVDTHSRLILKQQMDAASMTPFDISALPPGSYCFIARGKTAERLKWFVKN